MLYGLLKTWNLLNAEFLLLCNFCQAGISVSKAPQKVRQQLALATSRGRFKLLSAYSLHPKPFSGVLETRNHTERYWVRTMQPSTGTKLPRNRVALTHTLQHTVPNHKERQTTMHQYQTPHTYNRFKHSAPRGILQPLYYSESILSVSILSIDYAYYTITEVYQ